MRELFGIFIFFIFSILFSLLFCIGAKKKYSQDKNQESIKIQPIKIKRELYMQAIGLIYLLQLVFMFPVFISYKKLEPFLFVECFVFILMLILGFVCFTKRNYRKD